jgi:hypothetical protein
MVIGEKMFSRAQQGGEGGEGTVEMYGESSQEQDGQRSGIRPDYAS